jgi:hypothetical protein
MKQTMDARVNAKLSPVPAVVASLHGAESPPEGVAPLLQFVQGEEQLAPLLDPQALTLASSLGDGVLRRWTSTESID